MKLRLIIGSILLLACQSNQPQSDIGKAISDSISKYDSLRAVRYMEELDRLKDSLQRERDSVKLSAQSEQN